LRSSTRTRCDLASVKSEIEATSRYGQGTIYHDNKRDDTNRQAHELADRIMADAHADPFTVSAREKSCSTLTGIRG